LVELDFCLSRTQRLNCVGKAFFQDARAFGGDVAEVGRGRRSCQHQHEGNDREADPRYGCGHKHVVGIERVKPKHIEGYMLERFDMFEDSEREEGKEHRKRSQDNQGNVQTAMELLPSATTAAIGEMLLIIPAHLWVNPRNVIPPACKDSAHNTVGTLGFRHTD